MVAKIFIDGEVGTTGLQIKARLDRRDDVSLISLDEAHRKDPSARLEAMEASDVAILCLPDEAARQAASLAEGKTIRLIDASSAHRTAPGWVYGFPEYDVQKRAQIASADRVTNPGCYAISSVALLSPLVKAGLLPSDWPVTINAVSGYSGGGKALVKEYEAPKLGNDGLGNDQPGNAMPPPVWGYGLSLEHKHVPEIQHWGGLTQRPLFSPSVGQYRQGMLVQLPLQLWSLAVGGTGAAVTPGDLVAAYHAHYADEPFVEVVSERELAAMTRIDPQALNGTNKLRIHVFGNADKEQAIVMALIDNLGKGASGQAVQNLNIMLGLPEEAGLTAPLLFEG